jgi:hypothetical protein
LAGSGVWVQHGVEKNKGSIESGAGEGGRANDERLIGERISLISRL